MDSRCVYRFDVEILFIRVERKVYHIWNYFYGRCMGGGEVEGGEGRLTTRTHLCNANAYDCLGRSRKGSIVLLIMFDS